MNYIEGGKLLELQLESNAGHVLVNADHVVSVAPKNRLVPMGPGDPRVHPQNYGCRVTLSSGEVVNTIDQYDLVRGALLSALRVSLPPTVASLASGNAITDPEEREAILEEVALVDRHVNATHRPNPRAKKGAAE